MSIKISGADLRVVSRRLDIDAASIGAEKSGDSALHMKDLRVRKRRDHQNQEERKYERERGCPHGTWRYGLRCTSLSTLNFSNSKTTFSGGLSPSHVYSIRRRLCGKMGNPDVSCRFL